MKNKVHLIDCMEFMKDLPDNAYELAIVDPPYGIGDFSMKTSGAKKGGLVDNPWNYTWNEKTPDEKYFDELFRISKNQIIWGANYYNCFTEKGGAIVWDKGNKHPNMSKCEIASCSFQKKVDFVSITWLGFMKDGRGIHPCEKPVTLYKWLLKNYAKPGEKIFDSHVGSGSIRIACHDLGFDFEGCELDEDYWNAQEQRYKNHIAQSDLFETDEIQELVYRENTTVEQSTCEIKTYVDGMINLLDGALCD